MKGTPRFTMWDKIGLSIILTFLLTGALWIAVPSRLFLDVQSVHIGEDRNVTIVRKVRFGGAWARWDSEITTIGREGRECHDHGRSFYQPEEGNQVTYDLGDWAEPCLRFGPPFVYRAQWSVRLFNFIPLRPVVYTREYSSDEASQVTFRLRPDRRH